MLHRSVAAPTRFMFDIEPQTKRTLVTKYGDLSNVPERTWEGLGHAIGN